MPLAESHLVLSRDGASLNTFDVDLNSSLPMFGWDFRPDFSDVLSSPVGGRVMFGLRIACDGHQRGT